MYDVSIRYFQPTKIEENWKDGIHTEASLKFYHTENIGNLSSLDWRNFGDPFKLKKGENAHYRFHVNSRKNMYWYSRIIYNNGEIFPEIARKKSKRMHIRTDTIIDNAIVKNFGKKRGDTVFLDRTEFLTVDSVVSEKIPIKIIESTRNW